MKNYITHDSVKNHYQYENCDRKKALNKNILAPAIFNEALQMT